MEFPTVPRLFSFMAAPATLPPTAPLITSIMRLMMFIGLVLCFVCVYLHWLIHERVTAKIGKPTSRIALPLLVCGHISHLTSLTRLVRKCPAACDGGHAALKFARPKENRL